jgi:hypothetical protein
MLTCVVRTDNNWWWLSVFINTLLCELQVIYCMNKRLLTYNCEIIRLIGWLVENYYASGGLLNNLCYYYCHIFIKEDNNNDSFEVIIKIAAAAVL